MLSIVIYSDQSQNIETLRSLLQDFLIENKAMAKVYYFSEEESFITTPNSFDIYIMDMESSLDVLAAGQQKYNVDVGSTFIYLSKKSDIAHTAAKSYVDYCLSWNISPEEFKAILAKIKRRIRDDSVIIKIPGGERRIRSNLLNYIDIEKRCLCYHLKDGNMFDGQSLRGAFEKAIDPLQHHPGFLFLPPSLLINVGEIKEMYTDHLTFENDDVLYFPKKAYDTVHDAWIKYSRVIN